jgi:hypothetical protein
MKENPAEVCGVGVVSFIVTLLVVSKSRGDGSALEWFWPPHLSVGPFEVFVFLAGWGYYAWTVGFIAWDSGAVDWLTGNLPDLQELDRNEAVDVLLRHFMLLMAVSYFVYVLTGARLARAALLFGAAPVAVQAAVCYAGGAFDFGECFILGA